MFEISVLNSNDTNNFLSHARVKVTDLSTNQICIISFSENHSYPATSSINAISKFDEDYLNSETTENGPPWIKLYSTVSGTVDDFITTINSKFRPDIVEYNGYQAELSSFSVCCNNCSDAANYTLNYFFPKAQNKSIEAQHQTLKCLTSICCILSLGFLKFAGTPPCFNGPMDVQRKAELLSKEYGDRKKVLLKLHQPAFFRPQNVDSDFDTTGPSSQKMEYV